MRKNVSRGPPIELHLLGWSGPIFKTMFFFDVFDLETSPCLTRNENPKKDPELVPVALPLERPAHGIMPKLKNARLGRP